MAKVKVHVLGGLRVSRGNRSVSKFRTRQAAGLLAYLACHRKFATRRDVLLEVLWFEADPSLTRQRLSQAISSLRNVLEPERGARGTRLLADRETLVLATNVSTDLEDFENALLEAESAETRIDRLRSLERAVASYGGTLLPSRDEDWIHARRRELETKMTSALSLLRDAAQEDGDLPRALEFARRTALEDPLEEVAHASWFRLLMECDQSREAVRQFDEFERRLETELGVSAEPETAAIVHSAPKQRVKPKKRTSRDEFEFSLTEGATFTVVAVQLRGSGESRILSSVVRAAGRRVVVRRQTKDRVVLGFLRVPEALSAVAAFRTDSKLELSPDTRRASGGKASIVVGLVDARVERGGFVGASVDRLLALLCEMKAGWTVTTAGTLDLLGSASERDYGARPLGSFGDKSEDLALVVLHALSESGIGTPLPELPRKQGNVPYPRTRFFGREHEMTTIQGFVAEKARLITLLGPGGVGKTRLSSEIALSIGDSFAGGAWSVPLESTKRADQIPAAVCTTLGIAISRRSGPLLDAIVSHLSEQPSLLILDNLEQLLPEASPFVTALCDRLESTVVLVTSRKPVGVSGEHRLTVNPIPLPDVADTVEVLKTNCSVQLFVDRAQSQSPGFQLTDRNAETVVHLIRHLDGLPLAIELAAARVAVLSPSNIIRRFKKRTDLVDRYDERPARHQRMSETIDWSYRLLDPAARHAFVALSIFRGSFDLAAVEAVTKNPRADDTLAELVDSSLVVVDLEDEPRFHLLETLREFAADHVTKSQHQQLVDRHASYYRQLAGSLRPGLITSQTSTALRSLDRDKTNYRAALDNLMHRSGTARSRRQRAQARVAAIDLLDTLAEYWSIRGLAREGLATLLDLIETRDGIPEVWIAKALFHAGSFADLATQYDRSDSYLKEAAAIFEKLGNLDYLARCHQGRGIVAFDRGRPKDAEVHHRASLPIHEERGDQRAIAQAYTNIGTALADQGRNEDARSHFERSLELKRQVGSKRDLASALMGLGNLAERLEDYESAITYHQECLDLVREIQDERVTAMSVANLGSVTARRGDLNGGIDLLIEAANLHHGVGATAFSARSLLMIALLPGAETQPEWITPILAAGVGLMQTLGVELPAGTRVEIEKLRDRLSAQLGRARFLSLYDEGASLSAEEAVQQATIDRPQFAIEPPASSHS